MFITLDYKTRMKLYSLPDYLPMSIDDSVYIVLQITWTY